MRTQGRRSRLIIRRVDPWTILKFSVLLFFSLYFVVLVAGLVLWAAATGSGVRENIESFIGELIASENFKFNADQIARASVVGGAILLVVGSLANVLIAVLFNLISDIVGGVGISVEERTPRRRRIIRRRQPSADRPPVEKSLASARDRDQDRDRERKDRNGKDRNGRLPQLRPPKARQSPRPPGGRADLGG